LNFTSKAKAGHVSMTGSVFGFSTPRSSRTLPMVWYPRLLDATPAQRKNWKIAGGGYGIHWPDLDEDVSTEGLLRGAPAPKAHARTK
jgi:hypothetical protein